MNYFVEDVIYLSSQDPEWSTKLACLLALPSGKISNQLIRIMIALNLKNYIAEGAIFVSSQDSETSMKQNFHAH